jgi:cysteine desulfuration protein SufE
MTETSSPIPDRLQEIVAEFRWAEGREKLDLLLEYSQKLPPLPDWLVAQHDTMDQVHECMTPVFVAAQNDGGALTFFFDVPAESPTVRGYAALMAEGLAGSTADEILAVPGDFFRAMGLQEVISYQRINGISAVLAHMKRLAVKSMNDSS